MISTRERSPARSPSAQAAGIQNENQQTLNSTAGSLSTGQSTPRQDFLGGISTRRHARAQGAHTHPMGMQTTDASNDSAPFFMGRNAGSANPLNLGPNVGSNSESDSASDSDSDSVRSGSTHFLYDEAKAQEAIQKLQRKESNVANARADHADAQRELVETARRAEQKKIELEKKLERETKGLAKTQAKVFKALEATVVTLAEKAEEQTRLVLNKEIKVKRECETAKGAARETLAIFDTANLEVAKQGKTAIQMIEATCDATRAAEATVKEARLALEESTQAAKSSEQIMNQYQKCAALQEPAARASRAVQEAEKAVANAGRLTQDASDAAKSAFELCLASLIVAEKDAELTLIDAEDKASKASKDSVLAAAQAKRAAEEAEKAAATAETTVEELKTAQRQKSKIDYALARLNKLKVPT